MGDSVERFWDMTPELSLIGYNGCERDDRQMHRMEAGNSEVGEKE